MEDGVNPLNDFLFSCYPCILLKRL